VQPVVNLAGVSAERANLVVLQELGRAGVPEVVVDPGGEVLATFGGRLGTFTFCRAWYYWVVGGRVPLDAVVEMYQHPAGRHDVRINGHCGCPAPREHGTNWIAPDGKQVYPLAEQDVARRATHSTCASIAEIGHKVLNTCYFADPPWSYPGVKGFVDLYHIDSERGLRLFADTVKRHGLG
jgi:hypothetical protein